MLQVASVVRAGPPINSVFVFTQYPGDPARTRRKDFDQISDFGHMRMWRGHGLCCTVFVT